MNFDIPEQTHDLPGLPVKVRVSGRVSLTGSSKDTSLVGKLIKRLAIRIAEKKLMKLNPIEIYIKLEITK